MSSIWWETSLPTFILGLLIKLYLLTADELSWNSKGHRWPTAGTKQFSNISRMAPRSCPKAIQEQQNSLKPQEQVKSHQHGSEGWHHQRALRSSYVLHIHSEICGEPSTADQEQLPDLRQVKMRILACGFWG